MSGEIRQSIFNIADWHVDTAANRLSRDSSVVKLEAKVMDVLHYLAQHPNQLVRREELEQAIWGDTVVGYDALTRCIAQLRKALQDDSREPRFIETIPKKGYRLIAPINMQARQDASNDQAAAAVDSRHSSRSGLVWAVVASSLLVVIALIINTRSHNVIELDGISHTDLQQPSIVVLPFTYLESSENQRYFSDGITADITTALSKLSGLRVISYASASGYQDASIASKQAAASLGVRYVLLGNVRLSGERIRVNVNLLDSNSDIYLWSEKYDRELRSVFDVQDDITENIIQALSIKLTEEEKRRTARRYTTSLQAYDDFLRGQAYYIRHNKEDNRQARFYFQQAIDRDEAFARAYSAMALTYVAEYRYDWNKKSTAYLDQALLLAQRGSSLDPELPQAYWVLGYVNIFRSDYTRAQAAARQAMRLDPNFADSYLTLAICEIYAGKPEDATRLIRKAMLLNPHYPAAYASILGQSYYFSGAYENAVSTLNEAIERNNNLLTAHVFLIAALTKLNHVEAAEWAAEQLKAIDTDFSSAQVSELVAVKDSRHIEDLKKQLQLTGL